MVLTIMTDLILYPRLSTRSRRAIVKTKKRHGQEYVYNPRGDLLLRLSQETGLDMEAVYNQLLKERAVLLNLLERT